MLCEFLFWRQIKKTISHYRLQKLQIIYNVPNIKDLGESKIFNLIIISNIMFKLILKKRPYNNLRSQFLGLEQYT